MKNKTKYLRLAAPVLLLVLNLFGCQDTIKLPVDQGGITGSGDTVFIKLNPPWDEDIGIDLSTPSDIIIGPDGLVYIADTGNDRIVVLNRSGEWQTMGNLDDIGEVEAPTGLAFDDMMNLYICNNTGSVYIWNRYLNNYGVEAVAQNFTLADTVSGETMLLDEASEMLEYINEQPDPGKFWVLIDISWDNSPEAVNEVLLLSTFYQSPTSQFYQPAVDPLSGNTIYLTDPGKQRIYRVRAVVDKMVLCSNGWYGFSYKAEPLGVAVSFGTGKLTCDQPRGITFDSEGYMLFAQVGGNFKIQKLTQDNFAVFNIFGFSDSSDIMVENRFANPLDVCIGRGEGTGTGWIYAVDTDSNRVQVFNSEGDFLMNAGYRPQPVDTTIIDTIEVEPDSLEIVQIDTILVLEINDELNHPAGAAVFDGILYIADTQNNRIMRYALSSSQGDLPGQGF